jgi:hypothetical protein
VSKPSIAYPMAAGLFLVVVITGWFSAWAWNANDAPTDEASATTADAQLYPVLIRQPDAPAKIDSGQVDIRGDAVMVSCATCHSVLKPADLTVDASRAQFHKGLQVTHGNISCRACHDRTNFDQLALADGTAVPFTEVMTLCSQCHGTQARDYHNGSHGGMTGHWDRTKGPQHRNGCTDCHDPHAPAFPQVTPAFSPQDRFPPVNRI